MTKNEINSSDVKLLLSKKFDLWPGNISTFFDDRIKEVCGTEVTWENRDELEKLRPHLQVERDLGMYQNYIVVKTISKIFNTDDYYTTTFRGRKFVVVKKGRNLVFFDLVRILFENKSGERYEKEYDLPELLGDYIKKIEKIQESKRIKLTEKDIFVIGYEDFYLFGKKWTKLLKYIY